MIQIGPIFAVLAIAFSVAVPTWALDEKSQGDVRFLSGGVGETEIAEIMSLGSRYPLQLLTADRAGQFIAGVHVSIQRGATTVLETDLDGPYLLAKLPPGTYRLRATFEGRTIERMIVIGFGRRTVALHW